jgi:hypothetical protein
VHWYTLSECNGKLEILVLALGGPGTGAKGDNPGQVVNRLREVFSSMSDESDGRTALGATVWERQKSLRFQQE